METIRDTIKVLFHESQPNSVLCLQKEFPRKYADENVDRKNFCRLIARSNDRHLTLDNAEAIYAHLKEQWMQKGDESSLAFSRRQSVFNVLLHFSSVVLTERCRIPVCRYEHLLRWHDVTTLLGEDLLTVSFLAAKDLQSRCHRDNFCWPMVVNHDNHTLNGLFSEPLYDLHFHLKGSSLNFELNWMSLMNRVSGRAKQFKKLHRILHNGEVLADGEWREPFSLCIMKAATLRLLLFEYVVCGHSLSDVPKSDIQMAEGILYTSSVDSAVLKANSIDAVIQRLRHRYGKRYCGNDGMRVPDYATIERITMEFEKSDYRYAFTTLTGERWLMYELFRDIYSTSNICPRIVAWFYAYLLYKAQFRTEMVQDNGMVGFANFNDYEGRKSLFIRDNSVYDTLLSQLAVLGFIQNDENRRVEMRITPKNSRKQLITALRKTECNLTDSHFLSNSLKEIVSHQYSFVLHFIKKADECSMKKVLKGHCRHHDLRYIVKRQAHAIWHLRKSASMYRGKVSGIDAANSEIYARPEVFAQAYRFLRESTMNPIKMKEHDLGMTYHVGEDFCDVVDGLRAVDEVINFLVFRNGDRLGHGMVLGIDVHNYYKKGHGYAVMPKQVLLDNVVWLYFKGKDLPSFVAASKELEILYEMYFLQLFGHLNYSSTIWDYWLSWALRGDNPQYYFPENNKSRHRQNSRWSSFNLSSNQYSCMARKNEMSKKLYSAYHFDLQVRKNGAATTQVHFSEAVVSYISDVQEKMLDEIERADISVECNPTSNLRIGHFDSYSAHPIVRMFNYLLPTTEKRHSISVTINTDDKGIFATSIEREFSLLALSLEKKYVAEGKCSPRQIYDWLEKIRLNSKDQIFKME